MKRPPVHAARIAAPAHQAPEANRQARRALHTGVKAWRILRERILMRDCYLCASCSGEATEVDHRNGNARDNSPANLQSLCATCHSRKTATEQRGNG